jgi:hypothetical protein
MPSSYRRPQEPQSFQAQHVSREDRVAAAIIQSINLL